jgi:hypothetical protein
MKRIIFLSVTFVALLGCLVVSSSAVSWETFAADYYGDLAYVDASDEIRAEYALVEGLTDEEYASRFDTSESGSSSDDLLEAESPLEASSASASESSIAVMAVEEFPSNNTAYTDPVLVRTEYVPDADEGTLLSVLYDLFGKPVRAYHYSYQGNYQNSYTQYKVVEQDYDVAWCSQVIIFILVLWCTLKIGGGLICKNK